MFSLRTAKGRRAALAVLTLALTLLACTSTTVDPEDAAQEVIEDAEEAADDVVDEATGEDSSSDGDGASGEQGDATDEGEGDSSAEERAQEAIAAADETYESCHEANSAGGASDGVLFFALFPGEVDLLTGIAVEIDVEKGDGSVVTVPGTLQDDGMVFLIPLSSFGEVITIVDVRVAGRSFDPGVVGTQYTVEPESSCENHPEVE